MPSDNDTNPQADPTTKAAYGLPELRKAMKTGAEGIRKLMKRVELPENCHNLLPTSLGVYGEKIPTLPRPLKLKARQRNTGEDTPTERSSNELMLQRTIDDCLSYFYSSAFVAGKPGFLGFSQKLFGPTQSRFAHRTGELTVHSAWVCDQFIGAKRLSDVVRASAPESCLKLEDDRPVSKLEKSVLRCLKNAATNAIPGDKAHLNVVRIFLKEELRFLEGVRQDIADGRPVTSDEVERLGDFLSSGSVETVSSMEPGSTPWSFNLVFFPEFSLHPLYHPYPSQVYIARLLAAPVAFEICRGLSELSRDRKRKQFIQKCRAPSCHKLFFTSRANAKACESTTAGEASSCKSEWDKYSRWLKNCGHKVDTQWNDADVIKQFMQFMASA